MSQATAVATGGAVLVDHASSGPAPAPTRAAPDRPELDFPAQPLVISAAWWILIIIAVIHALWD